MKPTICSSSRPAEFLGGTWRDVRRRKKSLIGYNLAQQQGRSQDFGEGGAECARTKRAHKFGPRPLTKWKGRSSNYHREHVLTVASELESKVFDPISG